MNRILTNLAALLVAGSLLTACNDPQPQTASARAPAVELTVAPTASWPPAAPANLAVAQDLSADNYVLVLDDSGSMSSSNCGGGKSRMSVAQQGSIKFGKSLPAPANLGLVVFSGRVPPLSLGTGNRAQFEKQVNGTSAGGGTPLVASITLGRDMLTVQAQKQRGYGNYHLVVVTDGESGDGNPGPLAKEIVTKTAINVHVIGFCVDKDHSLYLPGYTRYTSALNPQTLEQGLRAVLAESESYADAQFVIKK